MMRKHELKGWKESLAPKGNFAPIQKEIEVEGLEVVGHVPADLNGLFVRNGPNPHFPPRANFQAFDGDGMLHGVQLHNGQASYRNRYVRTKGFLKEHKARKSLWTSLADPPSLKNLLMGRGLLKNTANAALVWSGDRLLALREGGPPHEILLPELSTVGLYTFQGQLKGAFTAHPKVDPISPAKS